MRIDAITVCVSYSDLLRKGMNNWKRGLDSLLVVTTPTDIETQQLCVAWDMPTFKTTAFYQDGAVFNKGRAIAEAYERLKPADWVLFFDSDIIPPADWREVVESAVPTVGNLYGAPRCDEKGNLINDGEMPGYFHLFHSADQNAQERPIVDDHWSHAGAYDSYFSMRWFRDERIWLPMTVTHQGETGQNWFGRGNHELMQDMREQRIIRGGHQHERINRADV